MRNKFGASPNFNGRESGHHVLSPDQLAVTWNPTRDVVAAWPMARDGSSWEIQVERFPSDFNLAQSVSLRRGGQAGRFPVSEDTFFLTTTPDFSERTRILALDGERLALDDRALVEWLITAEQEVVLGTDNHPLFETSLDDTACVISRLPNGLVAVTEVPRAHVLSARERIAALLGDRISSHLNICIETPLRTTARYFLTAVPEGERVQRPGKESEVTAFMLISHAGFRFGLWSPTAGLFSEYGFLAPKGIARLADSSVPAHVQAGTGADVDHGELEAYVRDAFEQLSLQLPKEKLEQLQLSGYTQVVWASEPRLAETITPIAAQHASEMGIDVFHLEAPIDETAAGGLLLGSFAFGSTDAVGATIIPTADLAHDLLVLADTKQDQRRFSEQLYAQKRRNTAIFALLGPPVAAAAVIVALITTLVLSSVATGVRDARATERTAELKPALDRRNSYEANLKWYQEFIRQVSRLRKQQPVGIGLLYQLNSNYPFSIDPSFYVSDMKLQQNGAVEMKGFARNKDAVASFLKALEFAGGAESGSRLFSNLAYEVQEGQPAVVAPAGQGNVPAIAGSLLSSSKAAPGVIVWTIRGNYLPVGEFVPAAPTKGKPGSPPPAATPAAGTAPATAPGAARAASADASNAAAARTTP